MRRGLRREVIGLLLPVALLIVSVTIVTEQVPRYSLVFHMWRPWAEIAILAAPMTMIMLTGGIDLSIGSMIALSCVVMGQLWHQFGWPIHWAALGAAMTGLFAGGFNGLLVIAGLAPLVATLATMAFYAGLAMSLSSGERIAGLPADFAFWGQGTWGGLPLQIWFMAAAFLVAYVAVHHTRFGRYLFAIGDNRVTSRYAAVPVRRTEWAIYATSGLVAGLVAVVYSARGGAVIPTAGAGLQLQTIACVVLGGTRVTGGEGGILRTVLGVAIMTHLDMGLQFLSNKQIVMPWSETPWRFTADWRLVLIGALVIFVAIWNERVMSRRA